MKLLVDENVPIAALLALRSEGHDAVHVAESMKSASDEIVLGKAASEERILVSFDRDFGSLVYARKLPVPRGIVLLRFTPRSAAEVAELLVHLMKRAERTWVDRFSVIERERMRQRPLKPGAG